MTSDNPLRDAPGWQIEEHLPDLVKALTELAAPAQSEAPAHAARPLIRCQQMLAEREQGTKP
jgi:hypothetical protein